MAERKEAEIVRTSGDMGNTVVEIDTCQYGMEHYPKGYERTSAMGEMPMGQWAAEWHPQGSNYPENWRDDTNPSDASKPADKVR